MNKYYAKTALYAYPNLEAVAEQIDELVERRAIISMNNYSPAVEQCEKVVDLTYQKDVLFALKLHIEDALEKLNQEELDCLEYKYFKRKPKEYFIDFDAESRSYFRRQNKLADKISKSLERGGATDKWFEEHCLSMEFFSELLKRVIEREKQCSREKSGKAITKSKAKKTDKIIQKRLSA
jgi:hypothetical protein